MNERTTPNQLPVTIDGKQLNVNEGMTILEAARANGFEIPTLCYHKDMTPIGVCRLCVVEVQGSRTLVASCHTPIGKGMVISTNSPKVIEARKAIVELMLSSHPDACLICDKANACELRRIAADLGIGLPRFRTPRHYYPIEDVGPYIVRDMSKCVLCRRCVAGCNEIAKKNILGIGYRGFECKIVYNEDKALDSEVCKSCNVCIDLCPTGSLMKTVKPGETPKRHTVAITHG